MDGLSDILTAISNAKTPLATFTILAVVLAAIVWQVSKRATLSENTTQILVIGGYGLVGLLIVAGVASVFLQPQRQTSDQSQPPQQAQKPPQQQDKVTDVTISGKVYAGGDQRAGLVGAKVYLEPVEDFGQRDVVTDANGEFSTHFKATRTVAGLMWATEDSYSPTSQAFFSIDPANPSPPKQFINMGTPAVVVAANTPPAPQAVPPPSNAPTPTPQAAPTNAAAPAPAPGALPLAAHFHHVVFNQALAAHIAIEPHSAVAAMVMAPKPPAPTAAAVTGTMTMAAVTKPRTDYDALFAKIDNDEAALSNAATAAFDDGQWAQTIRFIQQAQKVSKTGVWKLTLPKLAAAYFLSGQTKLGEDTVAAIKTERARPGSILASPVAQGYFAHAAAMPAALAPADRVQIDSALH